MEDKIFLYQNTNLPAFLQFPEFLLQLPLSQTAKLVYLVLYDRARLSRNNDWTDMLGRVYVIFPIAELAKKIGKSESTIKAAMKELCEADLLVKQSGGFSKPNLLYIKYVQTGRFSDRAKKPAFVSAGNAISDSQFSGCGGDSFPASNKVNNHSYPNKSDRVKKRIPRGRYENIFLTDSELAELRSEFPADADRFIDELSEYAASCGKTYANYAAAVRRWAANDKKANTQHSFEDYECAQEASF